MTCKNCNTPLPENQTKCPNCGMENITETQSQQENDYISAVGAERTVPKGFSSKKNIIIIIIAAIVLIIGGVTAVAFTTNGFVFSGIQTILQLADRYLSEQNYEQAIIEFEKVLEIEPMNVDAYLGLAEAYMALGETDKAVKILEEGIEKTNSDRMKNKLEEIKESLKPVSNEPEQTQSTTVEFANESIDNEPNEIKTYFSVQKGDTINLTVNTNEKTEWTSLNPYVAQINQNGTVTVLHKGRANIMAKFGNETKIFTIDSLSENVRSLINNAVQNGTFGTITDIIQYPDYFENSVGSGEFIERNDYDSYRDVESYSYANENYKANIFSYNYVYIENNDIGEENRIMVDGSTYNGLTFNRCETAFYEASRYEKAIVSFSTTGEITLDGELYYSEFGTDYSNSQFYISVQSVKDSKLPIAYYASEFNECTISLRMSETLEKKLKKKIDANNSLGMCKVTIDDYSMGFMPLGGDISASLIKVEFLNETEVAETKPIVTTIAETKPIVTTVAETKPIVTTTVKTEFAVTEPPVEEGTVTILGVEYDIASTAYLNLGESGITDEILRDIIPEIKKLTNLTELNLRKNQISDITPIAVLNNLTRLNLYQNQIADIDSLTQLTNLTWLNLSNNQITNIYPLAQLTNLKMLYLNNNPFSYKDFETLRSHLPNCIVYW